MEFHYRTALLVLFFLITPLNYSQAFQLAGHNLQSTENPMFVTPYGLGPDKWASTWLLRRVIAPDTKVVVLEGHYQHLPTAHNIESYDAPESRLYRTHELSTFNVMLNTFNLDNIVLLEMAQVINDVEINLWRQNTHEKSDLFETAFRELQRNHQGNVPQKCYMSLFDNFYELLAEVSNKAQSLSLPDNNCNNQIVSNILNRESNTIVPDISKIDLFRLMKLGNRIKFVDVREPEEFEENHIPGAINIPIRSLSDTHIQMLKNYDLIVSYCVKDFRGFEMAKILRERGIESSAILKPYGLKGWIDAELPMYIKDKTSEQDALAALNQYVNGPEDDQ